jgi:hypothetical protein
MYVNKLKLCLILFYKFTIIIQNIISSIFKRKEFWQTKFKYKNFI